jgi:hypothetical protein
MATSVVCSPRPCATPVGCMFTTGSKCIYYSGTAIPFMGIYPGNTLDQVISSITNYVGGISGIHLIVDTYADMITNATGTAYKRFLVLNDENKGLQKTVYEYWPTKCINWIAVTEEVNLE